MSPRALLRRPAAPRVVAALVAAAWVLAQLRAPLVEDTLFWWVPKALVVAERGPVLQAAGALPAAMRTGATLPPQWAGGLPDYAHPPTWYWWMGAVLRVLGPRVDAVHLAALPAAVLAAVGLVEIGAALGAPWAGLAALCLPPVLAQFLRADLDLPLLAVVPWALAALARGRWGRFAVLGFLAPLVKEPGVLLAVPAAWAALRERRLRPAALAPLAGLALWAVVGRLAEPERLPASPAAYARDLAVALRLVLLEQGRWLLLLGLPAVVRARRRPAVQVALALGFAWLAFFAAVGFFATRGGLLPLTHVRYFLPGMAVLAVLLAARAPVLALPGLLWLWAPSPFGPEASLRGIDAARAERAAAGWIAERAAAGAEVWVGSYQAAGLAVPWAGVVERPVPGLRVYSAETEPSEIPAGALLVVAAYGEPAGRLERGLRLRRVAAWRVRSAEVVAHEVLGPAVTVPALPAMPVP